MAARLGIVAGAGELPLRVIEACRAAGRPVFVLASKGSPIRPSSPTRRMPGSGSARPARGCACCARTASRSWCWRAAVRRPSLLSLRPDWRAAKFFAAVGMRALGDDGLLRAVIHELEGEGFRVVGADTPARRRRWRPRAARRASRPTERRSTTSRRGVELARALGALDIGQAVVVQQGMVLGVEAIEGTDALIARCGALRREGPGGVLVKIAKPGQERRADLPTIGVPHGRARGRGRAARHRRRGGRDAAPRPRRASPQRPTRAGSSSSASPRRERRRRSSTSSPASRRATVLGGRLMAALKERTGGAVRFAGIGGERMAAQGLTSLVPIAELAVMGVAEVLPRARRILRRVRETVADIRRREARGGRHHRQLRLHLARGAAAAPARRRGCRSSITSRRWCGRGARGRARRMARWYDHLMVLLPFEPPYFAEVGLACSLCRPSGGRKRRRSRRRRRLSPPPWHRARARAAHPCCPAAGAARSAACCRSLPRAVELLAARYPDLARGRCRRPRHVARAVRAGVAGWRAPAIVVAGEAEKYDAFAAEQRGARGLGHGGAGAGDGALPAVIAYRVNPLTHALRRGASSR